MNHRGSLLGIFSGAPLPSTKIRYAIDKLSRQDAAVMRRMGGRRVKGVGGSVDDNKGK
jgi:hypothetical protein